MDTPFINGRAALADAALLLETYGDDAGFALADLASIAFPGDRFVFDPAEELANSLAALLVSMPFVVFFWRRQAARREMFPASAGWTVYLSIMEAVFMTGFVVTASMFISGLLGGDSLSSWTGAVVFGAYRDNQLQE